MMSKLLFAFAAAFSAPLLAETLGPISEENPPATCDPGAFVTSIRCTGDYCDNIKIECSHIGGVDMGSASWTPFVSEEGGGRRECPANHYIAGFACNGRYCDNLSLYCVEAMNLTLIGCSMTSRVSEEDGGKLYLGHGIVDKAGQHIAARSVQCTGGYCDNKAFEVCEVALRPR